MLSTVVFVIHRGTLDPARTIRHLPTIVFMSWIALRIAVFSAISFDDPGITQCSATIEDACKRPWISVLVGQASGTCSSATFNTWLWCEQVFTGFNFGAARHGVQLSSMPRLSCC